MRLLSWLDQRGLQALGDQILGSHIDPAVLPMVQAARDALSPAPQHHDASAAHAMTAVPGSVAPDEGGGDLAAQVAAQYGAARASAIVPHTMAAPGAAVTDTGIPTASGPQWRSLGPWTIPNGQTYGSSRVNVSGRVSCIAIHPTNPARVLCGSANGGVWESFDRGTSWASRTDYASTLAVGALAYDRTNPNNVYCGLGEGNWWSFLGQGVLRSLDGGTSWAPLCTAPFVGQGFYDLQVSPSDGRRLVAATSGGLYVSSDGGVTWTRRRTVTTWSLAIAPGPVATAEMLAACSDGVFRSIDGGTTWSAVAVAGTPAGYNRLAVAIAPSNPTVAYLWGANGANAYLYRRSGGVWSALPLPPGLSTGQAWYDWFLAVSPDRDTQVYVGAIDCYRADLSVGIWVWTALSNKGSSGDSIHPDQHAIAFEPGQPATIYVGCDGGLYRSTNRGINWTHCNNGLQITEIEYLAQDYGSVRTLLAGTQDNGTELYTGSTTWTHAADGDGGDCGINRTNPQTVFHTFYGMSPQRSTSGGAFGSWANITPPVPAGEGSAFYPPFDASASGGDTIAMAGDALYVSRNNGTSWVRLAYPSATRGTAMHVPNTDRVYVGTSDGRVMRTLWASSWGVVTALTTPRAGVAVSDIKVDPGNTQRLWVTYSSIGGGRVFRSDNGGSSWIDCSAGLPNLPMIAVEVDSANSSRAWVAADLGVYQTLNAGATWADFSASLPNSFVGDLVFHPHARLLRAGLRNRGVWEIDVDGPLTTPICATQWQGTLAANQTQTLFTFNWPATWHMVWTVMPTTPSAAGAQLTWSVGVQRASAEYITYWITVQNLTATSVNFEGRYAILGRH